MRNRLLASFAAICVAVSGALAVHAAAPAAPRDRSVCQAGDLFCDDFSGTALDASKWTPNWLGSSGPVNGAESACYDPSHVTVHDGALDLKLTEQSSTCKGATRPETTGIVTTAGKFTTPATNYRVLVRAFVPADAAGRAYNWPAIWTDGTCTWPNCGESDVMEGLSGSYCYHYHSPSGGPGGCVSGYGNRWVTFREDVVGSTVTYYYGGTRVGSETVVQSPHFLILGNQGSGSYGGPRLADDLLIRSVRVRKL